MCLIVVKKSETTLQSIRLSRSLIWQFKTFNIININPQPIQTIDHVFLLWVLFTQRSLSLVSALKGWRYVWISNVFCYVITFLIAAFLLPNFRFVKPLWTILPIVYKYSEPRSFIHCFLILVKRCVVDKSAEVLIIRFEVSELFDCVQRWGLPGTIMKHWESYPCPVQTYRWRLEVQLSTPLLG